MGIATSYHQVLRAQCFPLRSIRPTVSTADHHRRSAPIRGKLCRIRPSPDAKPGRTPPFSLRDSCDFECSISCRAFRLFRLFGMPPTITHSSPFRFRPPIAASYALSDPPKPLFTSEYGCYQHRCRRISGCFVCTITCSL